jgi:hypothetical protein
MISELGMPSVRHVVEDLPPPGGELENGATGRGFVQTSQKGQKGPT